MKKLGLIFSMAFLLILSASVNALDLVNSQKEMTFVIEQGESAEFMLILLNTESDDVLFTYGDIEDWITFGEGNLAIYEAEDRGIDWVKVTLDVPEDAEVGEYDGGVTSNDVVSEITIKVVPPMDEIKSMQDLEEIKEELERMTESITQELNNTKGELQDKIAEISEYQQDLVVLQDELALLRERSRSLEAANTQLATQMEGRVVGGSPAQAIAGIIIGIVIVAIFLGRKSITRTLKGTKRPVWGEGYKGWKP